MNNLHAALIGLIEGLTEYLPVSSNAHVLLLGHALGEDPKLVRSFGVALQSAPALAVLALYWRRFDALVRPDRAGATAFKGKRAWGIMTLVTLPVVVCGLLFKPFFYGLMLSPMPSVAAMALGGVAILWVESHPHRGPLTDLDSVGWSQALGVGLFQCLALWPGVSRSGATIVGGLLLGLDRKAAAEFSFLTGVPVLIGASALELHKAPALRAAPGAFVLAYGVTLLVALLTVTQLMRLLGRMSFKPFGWYRLALAPVLYIFFR